MMSLSKIHFMTSFLSSCVLMMTTMMVINMDGTIGSSDGIQTSTNGINDGKFQMYSNVAIGKDNVSACITRSTRRGRFGCVDRCLEDPWCAAVYGEKNDQKTGRANWTCTLCTHVWDVSTLGNGTGFYAVAQYPMRGWNLPRKNWPHLVNEDVQVVNGAVIGTFECTKNDFSAGRTHLYYNKAHRTWPSFPDPCASYVCRHPATRNIVLSSYFANNISWIRPCASNPAECVPIEFLKADCGPTEVPYPYLFCRLNRYWAGLYESYMLCLPTTCYKKDPLYKRHAYKGTVNQTSTGEACLPWDIHSTHMNHYFSDDEFNMTLAKNYCRDIGRRERLWCYTAPRVERFCDQIPEC